MQQNLTGKVAGFCKTCLCFWRWKGSYRGTCNRDGTKTEEDWSCGRHSDIHETAPEDMSPENESRFK